MREEIMKKWALVVLGLYAGIIVIFTLPVTVVAFLDHTRSLSSTVKELLPIFACWPYYVGFAFFLLAQAALLDVHVVMADHRPLRKRVIAPVIVFSAAMMALLIFGAVAAVHEAIVKKSMDMKFLAVTGVLVVSWLVWGYIFYSWSKKSDHPAFLKKLQQTLFRGSILELLVAVPTHILARSRDYCCAGFNTFLGIVFGLAVMLCSFGPGVFFLFVERWKKLHPMGNK
jgi:hypothetical protein